MSKLIEKMKNNKALVISLVVCLAMSSMCFASEDAIVEAPDFSPIIKALQNVITPSVLITIIAATIGVGAAFVLMWFGYKKLKSAFVKGFTKGKL